MITNKIKTVLHFIFLIDTRRLKSFTSLDSLSSKRFRLISEQRKTEERDSRFWPREKWNKSQKMKVEKIIVIWIMFKSSNSKSTNSRAVQSAIM